MIRWFNSLSNRVKKSATTSATMIGFAATIMSVVGISLADLISNVWICVLVVLGSLVIVSAIVCVAIGKIYNNSVTTVIKQTPVEISYSDIFETDGWKVIGCDTHFDTRIDDVVISKKSLHGQLMLEHGDIEEIRLLVYEEAQRLNLEENDDGLFDFPLGTIIKYNSKVDNETYLMLAMTKLDDNFESHTNMAEFEHMLMKMWAEINRVYASNNIVLPLLGSGISSFDDGPKDKEHLLRCLLCTLNTSGISLNSNVNVVLSKGRDKIALYEYKNIFNK